MGHDRDTVRWARIAARALRRQPGRTRPAARRMFPEYARDWLASYYGRTKRGLANSTREGYKRDMQGRIFASILRMY